MTDVKERNSNVTDKQWQAIQSVFGQLPVYEAPKKKKKKKYSKKKTDWQNFHYQKLKAEYLALKKKYDRLVD